MATKEEIKKKIEAYHLALIESVDASQAEQDAKERKIKAHHNLSLARDALRGIEFEQY